MDIILFNTVINCIWYTFTIFFLLYKFTSFFSYGLSVLRFGRNVLRFGRKGMFSVYNYVQRQRGYTSLSASEHDVLLPHRNQQAKQSIFGKITGLCSATFSKVKSLWQPKKEEYILPVHKTFQPFENSYFEHQLEELYKNEELDESTLNTVGEQRVYITTPPKKNTSAHNDERYKQELNDEEERINLMFDSEHIYQQLQGQVDQTVFQSLIDNVSNTSDTSHTSA
jgi:hypothetical protein